MSINQHSPKLKNLINSELATNRNLGTAYDKIRTQVEYKDYIEPKPPIVHFDSTSADARRKIHHLRKINQT
jgi:hypothetical protein